jgi:hypothetical protein
MPRNILADEADLRVLRAAFDLAMAMGIDMDGTLDLARHLAREAIERSRSRAKMLDGQPLTGLAAIAGRELADEQSPKPTEWSCNT